jgi:hypothetical protein
LGLRRTTKQGTGENFTLRSVMVCTANRDYPGDQIKENEVGGSCDTYGGEERCIQNFDAET